MYTLQPLLKSGVFEAGANKLSCAVGGKFYTAELGPNGEIICSCGCKETYRSPSAFSVHIKRKLNPARKADDGWTSTKYMGVALAQYRGALEQLVAGDHASNHPNSAAEPHPLLFTLKRPKRRKHVFLRSSVHQDDSQDDSDHHASHNSRLQHHQPSHRKDQQQAQQDHLKKQEHVATQQIAAEALAGTVCTAEGAVAAADYAGTTEGHGLASTADDLHQSRSADSMRPPLHLCTEAEFESDLVAFLTSTGNEQLAATVLHKRITCNNSPLDLLGLYRAVVATGGLASNERYDDRGRWCGGINFAGDVFPNMKNYTPNNRATSVGNQLLNNYKKFLLAYEQANRDRDVQLQSGTAPAAAALGRNLSRTGRSRCFQAAVAAATAAELHVQDPLAVLAEAARADPSAQQQAQAANTMSVQQPALLHQTPPVTYKQIDGKATAASAVIGEEEDDDDVGVHKRQRLDTDRTSSSSCASDTDEEAAAAARTDITHQICQCQQQQQEQEDGEQLQQQPPQNVFEQQCKRLQSQQSHVETLLGSGSPTTAPFAIGTCKMQRDISGAVQHVLQLMEASLALQRGLSQLAVPGTLLLVQLERHQQHSSQLHNSAEQHQQQLPAQTEVWAAVVADISLLPLTIAEAGVLAQAPAVGQQQQGCSDSQLVPVLLLGSQQLTWVDISSCQRFTLPAVHAALSAVWSNNEPAGQTSGQTKGLTAVSSLLHSARPSQLHRHVQQYDRKLSCARGLKQAAQWALSTQDTATAMHENAASAAAVVEQQPRGWVAAAGLQHVSQQMLLLEGQLPLEALANRSSWFWEGWRAAVTAASTPEQLSHQVLMLAYQADAALREGVADTMWAELQQLLGIPPPAHLIQTGSTRPTCDGGALRRSSVQRHQPALCCVPSVLSLSEAVRVLAAAMDWQRLQQLWHVGLLKEAAGSAAAAVPSTVAAVAAPPVSNAARAPAEHAIGAVANQQQQSIEQQLSQFLLLAHRGSSSTSTTSHCHDLELPPPPPLVLQPAEEQQEEVQQGMITSRQLALNDAQLLLAKLLGSAETTSAMQGHDANIQGLITAV